MGVTTATALDPMRSVTQYDLRSWQTDAGLPQNSIQAITQSPDGYIWAGTQEGLVRFDGVRFTVYDKNSLTEMRSNDILSLFVDREGTLWAGTSSGGVLRMANGRFSPASSDQNFMSMAVSSIQQDQDGALWFGTLEHGLFRLRKGALTSFGKRDGLPSDRIHALYPDRNGGLWIGTSEGLAHLANGRFSVWTMKDGIPARSITALVEDTQGGLWIGSSDGWLFKFDREKITMRMRPTTETIWVLKQDQDGNLWIGTIGTGLFRLTDRHLSSLRSRDGLSDDFIQSIYEDRENNIWVGTSAGGLNCVTDSKFAVYSTHDGLVPGSLTVVCEDTNGSLWIGTDGAGVNRMKDGKIDVINESKGLSDNHVLSLACSRRGSMWIGTNTGGLNRIDPDGRMTKYALKDGTRPQSIWALCEDAAGSLWIGTYGHGLFKLKDGSFTHYTMANDLSHDQIISLCAGSGGRLWIGTNGSGLKCLADGTLTAYTTKTGLTNDFITSLYEDRDGTLWIGTFGGGLNRLKGGQLTSWTSKQGLHDDVVFQILEDSLGNLWMSSNKGIFRVAKSDLDDLAKGRLIHIPCVSFGKDDGLKSAECNGGTQPAGWRSRDGRLWFPTLAGIAMIDPAKIRINDVSPPVSIELLEIDKEVIPIAPSTSVPPGRINFEFQYTALSFKTPKRVHFRYLLEGFDRDWIDAGTRRTAYYTKLPPGKYRFRVIACNNDGLWNEAGASLELTIAPFFYQTLWFILLCVVSATLLIIGAHRMRVRQMHVREAELVRLVQQRTLDLEKANETLRSLSYKDGLTGVANRRHFEEMSEDEWKRGHRGHSPLSLLMIDVDFFKAYNDTLGHQAGDECLKQIADILSASLRRTSDLIARYGGEEFAVILPMTDSAGALSIAETLRVNIETLHILHPASSVGAFVTISVGAATVMPSADISMQSLVAAADSALYQAKIHGRNRLTVFESVLPEEKSKN